MTGTKDIKDSKTKVLNIITDMVSDFLYYDRKACEDFPVGAIEQLIATDVITVDEMVEHFRKQLV